MFTGIVQGMARIVDIEHREGLDHITVELPDGLEQHLELGASVANNGCCLTVTAVNGPLVEFDVMVQTLRLTNLADLKKGDQVNIERAARIGDEIGGHLMSGHIAGQAEVDDVINTPNNRRLWFRLPPECVPFVIDKGFVGVDGASLTVSEVDHGRFSVDLIPETLERTTLGKRQKGDRVNIELDPQTQAIITTVERILAGRA